MMEKDIKITRHQQKVYDFLVTQVPKGKVTTYGTIARAIGSSPRAVGGALKCNPYAPKIPCHRVVSMDGSIGGFNGVTKGEPISRKIALLKKEGVKFDKEGRIVSECIVKY